MEGKCPMCGMPVIIDTSRETVYPDFCRICAQRIMKSHENRQPELKKKIEKKLKRKNW